MSISEFYVQLAGALGYFFMANSYFNKQKKHLLIVQIISNIFLTIHYYFLSGITGAICDIVCIVSDTIIYFCDKHKFKNKGLLAVLLIIFLFVVCFGTLYITKSSFGYQEVFPVFATCLVISSLVTDSKDTIRLVGLIIAACWLGYAIIFGSIAGIAFEIVIIVATIASYIREKIAKNN